MHLPTDLPLGIIGDRPRFSSFFNHKTVVCPLFPPAVKAELRRILNAQHDWVRAHAYLSLLPVWGKDIAPCRLGVSKKAVGRTGFAPAIAGIRNAGRRVRRKSLHQNLRSLVEATIAKVQSCKLLIRPALHYLGQCVHPKSNSRRDLTKDYKTGRQIIESNRFSQLCRCSSRVVYNDMTTGIIEKAEKFCNPFN